MPSYSQRLLILALLFLLLVVCASAHPDGNNPCEPIDWDWDIYSLSGEFTHALANSSAGGNWVSLQISQATLLRWWTDEDQIGTSGNQQVIAASGPPALQTTPDCQLVISPTSPNHTLNHQQPQLRQRISGLAAVTRRPFPGNKHVQSHNGLHTRTLIDQQNAPSTAQRPLLGPAVGRYQTFSRESALQEYNPVNRNSGVIMGGHGGTGPSFTGEPSLSSATSRLVPQRSSAFHSATPEMQVDLPRTHPPPPNTKFRFQNAETVRAGGNESLHSVFPLPKVEGGDLPSNSLSLMDNRIALPPSASSPILPIDAASRTSSSSLTPGLRMPHADQNVSRRRQTDSNHAYICSQCGAGFHVQGDMTHHLRCHNPYRSRPHGCPHCGKRFQYRKDLTRHLPKHDPNAPRFYCPQQGCKYSIRGFGRQDHLDRHFASQHADGQQRPSFRNHVAACPTAVTDGNFVHSSSPFALQSEVNTSSPDVKIQFF